MADLVTSMLNDYQQVRKLSGSFIFTFQFISQGGWLPMWKNIVETNIMVGKNGTFSLLSYSSYVAAQVATHVDSLIAESMIKGVRGFDRELAYQAVHKDAFV